MTVTITLPDNLAGALQARADAAQQTLDDYVAGVLALDAARPADLEVAQEAIEDAVAQIRALPPRQASSISKAKSSLRDLLADAPQVTDVDEEAWSREWAAIEAEADARDRQDVIASSKHL